MADVAVVFGWPPSELREMEVEELIEWRRLALDRARALFGGPVRGAI